MSNTVIKIENISKQYRLGKVGTGTLANDLKRWWAITRGKEDPFLKIGEENDRTKKGNSEYVWALRDISFDVKQGDVVGIIGKNGAGKSTLLKILSRTTAPTVGNIKVKGRIASLLEVGTGFHPELTGRENVFLNGAILGMNKHEIRSKFDEIIDFAGIEKYIDTPVKRYSSGMYVRLAFAVAAHLEPEILVVDEVLAVGDAEFQKKAIGKMQDVSRGDGRTVLFVSHNMGSVSALCTQAMILRNGSVSEYGNVDQIIEHYLNTKTQIETIDFESRFKGIERPMAYYTGVTVRNKLGKEISTARAGEPLSIVLDYKAEADDLPLTFYVGVYNSYGDKILHLGSPYSAKINGSVTKKTGKVICHFEKLPIPEGMYTFNLSLHHTSASVDLVRDAFSLTVENGDYFGTGKVPPTSINKILVEQNWTIN